ncbi:MAG: hypothetical protein JNM39_18530 [Bdellovibrionaceae bacterium]|nr:hypothetical protein [Pseudobdellovibrionaceae bacterium]
MARIILKQLLIFPKIQLKYTAIYACVTLAPILVLMACHSYFIHQLTRVDLSIEEMSLIRQNSIELNIFIFVLTSIFVVLISILVTHRFLGPFIAIKRGLDSYLIDRKNPNIKIRKTDEAHSLVAQINEFFEALETK